MQKLIIVITISFGPYWVINNNSDKSKVKIDPRVREYVKDWCWEMEKAGIPWEERLREVKSIEVVPYSVDSRRTGLTNEVTHRITINENYIDRNPCGVRATVFHELGHAAFGLPHDCCFIMRTKSDPNEKVYCQHWSAMVDEYLVQCKKAQNER